MRLFVQTIPTKVRHPYPQLSKVFDHLLNINALKADFLPAISIPTYFFWQRSQQVLFWMNIIDTVLKPLHKLHIELKLLLLQKQSCNWTNQCWSINWIHQATWRITWTVLCKWFRNNRFWKSHNNSSRISCCIFFLLKSASES